MEPIIKGLLSGLAYGLLLGPLFVLNIRTTLSHGMRRGMIQVVGALASDSLLVLACWWGSEQLASIAEESTFQRWFGIICGLLLFGFGLSAVWPRKLNLDPNLSKSAPMLKKRYAFLQGFSVNTTNPSNWLFWLSIAAAAQAEAPDENEIYVRLFMVAALIALFCTDLSKVLLAHQIGRKLKPGTPEKIVRLAGFILMGVSTWIIIRVIQNN